MKEYIDLRLPDDWARKELGDLGKTVDPMTRVLVLETRDPKLLLVKEKMDSIIERGTVIGYYAGIDRKYLKKELNSAEVFELYIRAVFEPAGEECGTKYDYSDICPHCGAGRKQISDLILDLRKIPKKKDIARTIVFADEWIVSQRLAELLIDNHISGFKLRPVRHKGFFQDDAIDYRKLEAGRELIRQAEAEGFPYLASGFSDWINRKEQREMVDRIQQEYVEKAEKRAQARKWQPPVWHQLVITSKPVPLQIPPTKVGINYFNEDKKGKYVCPRGHIKGLNLISEPYLRRQDWTGEDMVLTQDLFGYRGGLLYPHPILLISPRLWRLLRDNNIKGFGVEVAHLI